MAYIGTPPQSGFITTAKQRVTGSTNNYVDLDHSISSLADVIVWVNSVKQDSTNLTLTTSTRITLGDTLTASDVVEIAYLGKAVATQTPDDNTITNDMLAGSIANSKLANSSITLNGSAVSLGGSASVVNTPAFEAFLSSDMNSLSNNTFTKITFDTESFDSDGTFDTSNNRFTPGVAGKYYVYGRVIFNDTNVSEETYHISIRKNGSQVSEFFTKSSAESSTGHDDPMMTYVEVVDLDADDYVEIFGAIANSNGSRGIHGSSSTNKFTTFGAFKLIGA